MASTDKEWQKLGVENPYYGVLSDPEFNKDVLDDSTLAEFFRTGQAHAGKIIKLIEENFAFDFSRARGVDFGCGVGRVAIPLSKNLKQLYAVDISDGMLDEARKNCIKYDADNVIFVKSDGNLTQLPGGYNFVHSFLVLQHIPVEKGYLIISQLLSALAQNGIAVIHVTYGRKASSLKKFLAILHNRLHFLSGFVNITKGRRWSEPTMRIYHYNLNMVMNIFKNNGINMVTSFTLMDETHEGIVLIGKKDSCKWSDLSVKDVS